MKMKLEVEKKWKEEKYPKSSKCNMIITNCIIMNRSNKLQNGFFSGIPTQINSLHARQNIPKKGFGSLPTYITTHFKNNGINSKNNTTEQEL